MIYGNPLFPESSLDREIERDRNENKTKKMRMAWTAVHKSCKIWDYLTRLRSLMSWSGRTNLLNYYLFLCSLVGVAGCAGWPGQWRGPGGVWVQGVRQVVHKEFPLQTRCLAPAGPTGMRALGWSDLSLFVIFTSSIPKNHRDLPSVQQILFFQKITGNLKICKCLYFEKKKRN